MSDNPFDVKDMFPDGPGHYPVVMKFTKNALVALYDGEMLGLPNTDDIFERSEILWVGVRLQMDQLFPAEIQKKYDLDVSCTWGEPDEEEG